MSEHPILFSTEMVKAILCGNKTMTRRVIKFPSERLFKGHPEFQSTRWIKSIYQDGGGNWIGWGHGEQGLAEFTKKAYPNGEGFKCPYGQVGDRLWVRETHYRFGYWQKKGFTKSGQQKWVFKAVGKQVEYYDNSLTDSLRKKGEHGLGWYKRPSIFMPRWASRITLEITERKVERLQDISHEDAIAEGAEYMPPADLRIERLTVPQIVFAGYWDSINAQRGYSWESNPYVWVIRFQRSKL